MIILCGPICAASFVAIGLLQSLHLLLAVRMIQGLSVAIAMAICPIYIAEITEPRIRASATSHLQTLWNTGVLFDYCLGPYLTYRVYAFISLIIPFIFTITFLFMPESPYYLLMKGKRDEAERALSWLRGGKAVNEDLKSIEESVLSELRDKGKK